MTPEPRVQPIVQPLQIERAALLALHAALPERYPALLESAARGWPLGRYDILFAFPCAALTLTATGLTSTGVSSPRTASFLAELDRWWREERVAPARTDPLLPFTGGWLLYLGYELANQIEPKLRLPVSPSGPIAQAMRIPAAIVFCHDTGTAYAVVESDSGALLEQLQADLAGCRANIGADERALIRGSVTEEPPEQYLQAIAGALRHIAAGDIYQANLSRGWHTRLAPGVRPHDVYRRLRQTNPAPFSALAQLGEIAIVSSSPERLVEVRDGWVQTRPIAGTRPRGTDPEADERLVRELRAHPKERAEHVMLIDLERNDLGRICEAGTVEVSEYMTVESYAHVHHIVSNVRGRLRGDVAPGQVLAAVFPGGTITGCPKIRCMELIAALEGQPRGAYTGSLGYLNLDGTMDMNILIRTIEIRGEELTFRAGGGIVADSVPERELEEARAKARGLVRALAQEGGA